MTETAEKTVLRDTDAEAIRQAKELIHTARHASLAANPKEAGGHPSVSRVQTSTDTDGALVVLTSALSPHTQAMIDQPNVSLLIGEPGKGDPLAHPRITVFARTEKIAHDTPEHARLRHRHLSRHPKAELYVDFGDFSFFKLHIVGASLNGGFGKAYELTEQDLAMQGDWQALTYGEKSAVDHMNDDHLDAVEHYATHFGKAASSKWKLATMDTEGMTLAAGDQVCRVWFPEPLFDAAQMKATLVQMAREGR
ncbi:MAG: DUF2470 domain-containing protein [Pseudomonadota bacterium]